MTTYDYAIIGGGIVGIATALQLQRQQPGCSVLVIEKEALLAQHQTGHNSGVIHAGVYYQPDSLKADFCKRGAAATLAFCRDNDIAYCQCGKLLVATDKDELQRMAALKLRCQHNDIAVQELDQYQLQETEPNIAGLGALSVAASAIVDYKKITEVMAAQVNHQGGVIKLRCELLAAREEANSVTLATNQGEIHCRWLISCSGLMADRVTKMLGLEQSFAIVPFRGEYYQLRAAKQNIVQRLIYPIPNPALPFLGVHLTPMIDGSISVGPNAVLGWQREGYGRFNINARDAKEMLAFSGFWRLLPKHFRAGVSEMKNSWYKPGYLRLVQKYCPQLALDDLHDYPAGIRAQAVLKDGSLVEDFLFKESPRSLHVCNAPSPAATSALPIGEYVAAKIIRKSGG